MGRSDAKSCAGFAWAGSLDTRHVSRGSKALQDSMRLPSSICFFKPTAWSVKAAPSSSVSAFTLSREAWLISRRSRLEFLTRHVARASTPSPSRCPSLLPILFQERSRLVRETLGSEDQEGLPARGTAPAPSAPADGVPPLLAAKRRSTRAASGTKVAAYSRASCAEAPASASKRDFVQAGEMWFHETSWNHVELLETSSCYSAPPLPLVSTSARSCVLISAPSYPTVLELSKSFIFLPIPSPPKDRAQGPHKSEHDSFSLLICYCLCFWTKFPPSSAFALNPCFLLLLLLLVPPLHLPGPSMQLNKLTKFAVSCSCC